MLIQAWASGQRGHLSAGAAAGTQSLDFTSAAPASRSMGGARFSFATFARGQIAAILGPVLLTKLTIQIRIAAPRAVVRHTEAATLNLVRFAGLRGGNCHPENQPIDTVPRAH